MPICDLIDPVPEDATPFSLPAQEWRQGRTLYGGASALVAYTAVMRRFSDLPPLRSAQIGFVAPLGDTIRAEILVLREGRNVVQVHSELFGADGLALVAHFLFGSARPANARYAAPIIDQWPGTPEENETVAVDNAPAFLARNYEVRRAQDTSGRGAPVVRRWLRLIDQAPLTPEQQMLLIGDTLPPGAMRAMEREGPLSSINWTLNILDTEARTRDGWWLAETASDHADAGYSSERLRLWNADGALVMVGQQAVAIFG